jgi:cyclic pyranopterin phosphate synthase
MLREDRPGLALRISVTDRCPLRCLYCRPGATPRACKVSDLIEADDIVRFVRVATSHFGVAKVRLTGGEPLARADIVAIVAALSQLGVSDLALTTNGQTLASRASALRAAGLRRVNVSLDSLVPETFSRLARGGALAHTLDGIAAASDAGLNPLRMNTVVLRGINDHEVESIIDFALARGHEARFIELMPSGIAAADYQRWFVPSDELQRRLEKRFRLAPEPYPRASSSRRFRVTGGGRTGVIGFISPNSHPFCAGCRRVRLTADGRLLGCLGLPDHIRILGLLRSTEPGSDERIAAAMGVSLGCKRDSKSFSVPTPMSQVGG